MSILKLKRPSSISEESKKGKIELAKDFFIRNRKKLKADLKKNSLVIIHSNDEMPRNGDQFFPFRQNLSFPLDFF